LLEVKFNFLTSFQMNRIFTSESVTAGHPDKIADQISDNILDAFLRADKNSRVACEVMVNTGLVVIAGEIKSTADFIDLQKIARQTILEIGYNHGDMCFDGKSCAVMTAIDGQSPDISQGVDNEGELGAGDQGMMFGFACRETEELMPLPITLAHKLTGKLTELRKNKTLEWLRPDGKSQISVEYDEENNPVRIDAVVISTQHCEKISQEKIRQEIIEKVIKPVLGNLYDEQTKIFVNPTGKFVIGGPQGDCGLTGRKIIVDTYGGYSRHGGGCFSGKDPSKVDRSGAYMARFIAKNLVANNLVDKCEVQLSYAIGISEPVSIFVEDFGTGKISQEKLIGIIKNNFDCSPAGIIERLKLLQPIYGATAVGGHFGRAEFPWEEIVKLKI
jgi:S-adenosylmethionine synthetase